MCIGDRGALAGVRRALSPVEPAAAAALRVVFGREVADELILPGQRAHADHLQCKPSAKRGGQGLAAG